MESFSASAELRDRVYLVLRALIRSSYFGENLPSVQKFVHMTRLPKLAIEEALLKLENDDLIEKQGATYKRVFLPDEQKFGRIVFLLNSNLFASWYGIFQDYLIGFEEVMRAAQFEVLFRSEFENLDAKASVISEFHVNGINGVAFASYAEPRLRSFVVENGIPSVVLGNATIHQQDLGCVCTDNVGGMRRVVEFLADNGHKQIVYYSSAAQSHDGFQERLLGYDLAMHDSGLRPMHELVFRERHSGTLARRASAAFLSLPKQPTAVACSCDREAFELLAELRQSGLSAPNDVSVTGFGNSIFGSISQPPLTSVEIYARDIGRVGANFLINEMHTPQLPVRMMLPTDLIVRESAVGVEIIPAEDALDAPSNKTVRIELPTEDEIFNY